MLSFLGAGCAQHHVPAICDEINSRGEFLTAYAGEPYEDHGRFQALFEYESMMAELLNMEVVNVPVYDGSRPRPPPCAWQGGSPAGRVCAVAGDGDARQALQDPRLPRPGNGGRNWSPSTHAPA